VTSAFAGGHALRGPLARVARFRVGGYSLAIDSRLVEQVITAPFEVTPLPCAPVHVPGAVRVRDMGIPLLDLPTLFGARREGPAAATPLAMIVSHPGGRFAVPVDELVGLTAAAEESFSAVDVQHPTAEGVFSRLYLPPDGHGAEVLIDVEAVARIAGLHSVLASPQAVTHQRADLTSTYFVVDAGGRKLALAASAVRRVQANVVVDPVDFPHHALLGFHQLGPERIAVVELAVILGLQAQAEPSRTRSVIVVEDARGAPVAFSVTAILDMERFAEREIGRLADDEGHDHPIWRGTYHSQRSGPVLVAECAALWRLGTFVDSRALFGGTMNQGDTRAAACETVAHMIYRVAGGVLASRVSDARAVVGLPADFVDLRGTGHAQVGLFTHKTRTVPVLDLAVLMGREAVERPVGKPVLVIDTARSLLGLLVDEVVCMSPVAPSPIPGASRRPYGVVPAFTAMVQVQMDGADRSVTVLDLDALGDHGDLMLLMDGIPH
jgi:chemotaxis signal transduction protein